MTENESTPKKIDVSFVIPCFNSQETITDTITSINAQAGSLSGEIVVIDSSSHEKVKEAINQ
ncbi:MAG: glycosyltransferase, partial [Anaerolineales bacterium]|nr:glycosyltransferase [Anaerolineales bacterium]